jgi:hypothetical protein
MEAYNGKKVRYHRSKKTLGEKTSNGTVAECSFRQNFHNFEEIFLKNF